MFHVFCAGLRLTQTIGLLNAFSYFPAWNVMSRLRMMTCPSLTAVGVRLAVQELEEKDGRPPIVIQADGVDFSNQEKRSLLNVKGFF